MKWLTVTNVQGCKIAIVIGWEQVPDREYVVIEMESDELRIQLPEGNYLVSIIHMAYIIEQVQVALYMDSTIQFNRVQDRMYNDEYKG